MVSNDSNGQDKQIAFPQHLGTVSHLVCKNGFSLEIWCKWQLFMAMSITITIFTDQTVNISQMLPDYKLFVVSIGVICDHPAISTMMFRSDPKSGP